MRNATMPDKTFDGKRSWRQVYGKADRETRALWWAIVITFWTIQLMLLILGCQALLVNEYPWPYSLVLGGVAGVAATLSLRVPFLWRP